MSKNNEKKKRNTKQQPYNVRSGYKKGPAKPKAPVRKTYRKTCTTATELFDMFINLEDELITEIINPRIETTDDVIAEMYTEENILATMEENIVDYVLRTSIPNIATKENVDAMVSGMFILPEHIVFPCSEMLKEVLEAGDFVCGYDDAWSVLLQGGWKAAVLEY